MPQPLLSADLFVREIAHQVGFTLPGKNPCDTAKALEELGYIQKANNAFEKTSIGQKSLIEQSILTLTTEVIDQIQGSSSLGTERYKCYECKQLKSAGHFGPRFQSEKLEGERHRGSTSPCKNCLARYHATQANIYR